MENPTRFQERENPSPYLHSSPKPTTSNASSNGNGAPPPPATPGGGAVAAVLPPLTPKTISRSEVNPYPTTFIQADTSSFKQVVQMLTGSSETTGKHPYSTAAVRSSPPDPPPPLSAKRPAFKLYERRHNSLKNLKISPLVPGLFHPNSISNPNSPATGAAASFSPRYKPEILSPSILDLPSLVLSPVTPLIHDPFNRPLHPNSSSSSSPSPPGSCVSAEDRAIAEKGFYLHPSPRTTPRDAQPPRLLPLFPVTSPRLAAAGTSTTAPRSSN